MPDRFGLKPYEIISLTPIFVFGLAGSILYETYGSPGEYLALFICIPPPIAFYLYQVWKNEKPSP
jgi:hypothetical protein